MSYLQTRLAERDISLTVTDKALDLLGQAGFDPVYGARPLKRAIQNRIENKLAQEILSSKFIPGDSIIVDAAGDELSFTKQ
jgi:ATP-dependent Clp protease ATP-binding subunit ClpB